jgi:uncharacterized protein YkwD
VRDGRVDRARALVCDAASVIIGRVKRSFAIALSAALAVGVIGVGAGGAVSSSSNARAASCRNDDTPLSVRNLATVRAAVVCLINVERKRFGLPATHDNAQLDGAAQAHSNDMVRRDYFSHNAPGKGGSTPQSRITKAGYNWSAYGENIAAGYPTALSVMAAWMSDVGHCANILYPVFADIGIGAAASPLPHFATGPAVWTADFGLKSGLQPPSRNTHPEATCPHGI